MAVYSISSIEVKDWDMYEKYMKLVPDVIHKHGGKYLVRGGEVIADSTNWHPKRVVILEFPDIESLNKFRDSVDYKPVANLKQKTTSTKNFMVVCYDDANY